MKYSHLIVQEIKKYTKGVENLSFKHEQILQTIEWFLYSKSQRILKRSYVAKNPKQFCQKLKRIQAMEIKDVLDYLDIKTSFRLQKTGWNENSFEFAERELNKLPFYEHPIEKLVK